MAFEREYEKPVQQGDEVEVTIESTGAKGDGVAKIDNFVVIVPGAKEGDRVKVRITRVLRKMAFGEIVSEGGEAAESHEEAATEEADEEESHEDEEEEDSHEEADEEEATAEEAE
jgi:predicted RNA-binding protein with TRAM domain